MSKVHQIPEEWIKKSIEDLQPPIVGDCDNIVRWRLEDIQKAFPAVEVESDGWKKVFERNDNEYTELENRILIILSQYRINQMLQPDIVDGILNEVDKFLPQTPKQ